MPIYYCNFGCKLPNYQKKIFFDKKSVKITLLAWLYSVENQSNDKIFTIVNFARKQPKYKSTGYITVIRRIQKQK